MQGEVIGGICLLAFLLSGGRSEELDVSKQPDELNVESIKDKELSLEDVRQSREESKKLKAIPNDLNITKSSIPLASFKNQLSLEVSDELSNGSQSKQSTLPTAQKDTNNVFSDQDVNAIPLPSYSHVSKEESRRDILVENDGIQTRNVDGSQSSENMNAYPYSPLSKSDSTSSITNDLRSGAPNYPFFENTGINSAQAYAGAHTDSFSQNNQGFNPYSYGYPPGIDANSGNSASASAFAQVSSGTASAQSSAIVIEDAQSRVIWPSELIFPSKIHGSENTIQCTKENELYHFWSRSFECLVCVCLNIYGLLEPVCAKCSACRHPNPSEIPNFTTEKSPPPEPFVPIPLPDSFVPLPLPNVEPYSPSASAPSLIIEPINEQDLQTTPRPQAQEVTTTCSPLPIGQAYTNPLHPCQLCTCREMVTESGAIEAIIQCQDNLECVLPPDVTTLPPIPDIPVPVPLPLCEKFPHHVSFPHPTDRCKVCKCSQEVSQTGLLEQQITCYHDPECEKLREDTTETATPPAPPIPIPVEPYAAPIPEPQLEPIPENISVPVPPPNRNTPNTPEELLPWPPISTPAPPPIPFLPKKGPLPGPPPHDSCRPYPPNQPFQHPWDDCQVCQCFVIKAIGVVNVEITCYTKLSCCIESPEQAISESGIVDKEDNQAFQNRPLSSSVKPPTPIRPYNLHNLQNQGYAKTKAITENFVLHNQGGAQNQAYAAANAISQNYGDSINQGYAAANAISQNSGDSINQGYAEANAISQNSRDSLNQGYATANANQGNTGANSLTYNKGNYNLQGFQNQAYAAANAISQNSGDSFNPGYAAANAISQNSGDSFNPGYAAANAISQNSGDSFNPGYAVANAISQNSGDSLNKGYAEATAISQNSGDLINQGYAEANAISQNSRDSLNEGYATANAKQGNTGANSLTYNKGDYNLQGFQNQGHAAANVIDQNTGPYNSKDLRNQDSVEANAIAQSDMNSLSNKLSGPYQSPEGSGQSLAEANAAYSSQGPFEPYKARIPQNQGYAESNALSQNNMNNPLYPGSYNSANAYGSGNGKAAAEADAEYSSLPLISSYSTGIPNSPAFFSSIKTNEKLSSSTYKPPLQYDAYNLDATQNNLYPEAMPQYNDRRTNTQKPLQIGQLSPGFSINHASAQANAQHSSILTSTFKPPKLYNQYNPAISQNSVRANPNAVYKGTLSMTDKPPPLYNPYNSGGTQNSLAEAIAQSQDYSLYYQPVAPVRANSYGFPYQSNYYYQNPHPTYSSKANTGLKGQHKKSPVKFAGNYDFNGQPEKIYSPQSHFNPYTGYSQALPTANLYSSLYPNNYDITPLYRPGQYGSSAQSTAEAFAGSKSQTKSGDGYAEDSDESQ